jgi:hypothetical protein
MMFGFHWAVCDKSARPYCLTARFVRQFDARRGKDAFWVVVQFGNIPPTNESAFIWSRILKQLDQFVQAPNVIANPCQIFQFLAERVGLKQSPQVCARTRASTR